MMYPLGLDIGNAAARDHRHDIRDAAAQRLATHPDDDYARGILDGFDAVATRHH